MKAQPLKPDLVFNPIVVTLETQEDLEKLYALVNHTSLVDAVKTYGWHDKLACANESAGNPSISYHKYHGELCKILK